MALLSILMSMMVAFAVSMTAWVIGSVSALEAFGLYIGVGFGVLFASFALLLLTSAWRARPFLQRQDGVATAMPALAPIPVRSSSS